MTCALHKEDKVYYKWKMVPITSDKPCIDAVVQVHDADTHEIVKVTAYFIGRTVEEIPVDEYVSYEHWIANR